MEPTREENDRAWSNGSFIAGGAEYPGRWAQKAAAFRDSHRDRSELDLGYGTGARHRLDLFHPDGTAEGLLVFVHGGYWLDFDKSRWSHLAAGALAQGWAVAMPSYTLAPEARIAAITQEIAQAVAFAAARIEGPVVVTGHSAGGHLAARMACVDMVLPRLARVVPISPVADLAPLIATTMNDRLRLDPGEAAAESPCRLALQPGVSAHPWVGGKERPVFLWQARLLSEAWDCDWTVAPGRHHFDVIDDLEDPDSGLTRLCVLRD